MVDIIHVSSTTESYGISELWLIKTTIQIVLKGQYFTGLEPMVQNYMKIIGYSVQQNSDGGYITGTNHNA